MPALIISRRTTASTALAAALLLSACASTIDVTQQIGADVKELGVALEEALPARQWLSNSAHGWMDDNKDGLLSFAEFEAGVTEDYRYREIASRSDMTVARFVAKDFARGDIDKDSQISQTEFRVLRDMKARESF